MELQVRQQATLSQGSQPSSPTSEGSPTISAAASAYESPLGNMQPDPHTFGDEVNEAGPDISVTSRTKSATTLTDQPSQSVPYPAPLHAHVIPLQAAEPSDAAGDAPLVCFNKRC